MAAQLPFQLCDQVCAGDEARNADVPAEKIVPDAVDRHLYVAVQALERIRQHADERIGQRTRGHIDGARQQRMLLVRQRVHELIVQQAPHAYAILQLYIIIVIFIRRDGPARQQKPFIAGIHHAHAVLPLIFFTVLFKDIQHLTGALPVVRLQRIQAVAVACQARGHGRDAAHRRVQAAQLFQAFAQVPAIVDAAAHHKLAVHLNARSGKLVDVFQHLARVPVRHHFHTQLRFHGMHGNVDGRDVHFFDTLHFVGVQVRHRDIIAEQKRQTLVVVLEIQRLPQAAGELVDEAEHAFVAAGVLFVDEVALESAPFPHKHIPASRPAPGPAPASGRRKRTHSPAYR